MHEHLCTHEFRARASACEAPASAYAQTRRAFMRERLGTRARGLGDEGLRLAPAGIPAGFRPRRPAPVVLDLRHDVPAMARTWSRQRRRARQRALCDESRWARPEMPALVACRIRRFSSAAPGNDDWPTSWRNNGVLETAAIARARIMRVRARRTQAACGAAMACLRRKRAVRQLRQMTLLWKN